MKFFAIIDLCRAFFSIPVDKASQYLFALLGKENNIPRQYCFRVFLSSSYFLQTLRADLDDTTSPGGPTMCA